jgi:hypothetical protein
MQTEPPLINKDSSLRQIDLVVQHQVSIPEDPLHQELVSSLDHVEIRVMDSGRLFGLDVSQKQTEQRKLRAYPKC